MDVRMVNKNLLCQSLGRGTQSLSGNLLSHPPGSPRTELKNHKGRGCSVKTKRPKLVGRRERDDLGGGSRIFLEDVV